LVALLAAAAPAVAACGFHDDVALERGTLNWSYPAALHVRTAVWRAQREELIGRDELPYMKVVFLLNQLRPHLPAPRTTVVLVTPMLWTSYRPEGVRVHAEGPAQGDVVLVTEALVVKAIVEHRLSMADALAGGMVRVYAAH
jgi:hypothetical protein